MVGFKVLGESARFGGLVKLRLAKGNRQSLDLLIRPSCQGDDAGGIDAAAEENAQRNVTNKMAFRRVSKDLGKPFRMSVGIYRKIQIRVAMNLHPSRFR